MDREGILFSQLLHKMPQASKKKKKRARAVFVWDEGTKNVYVEHMGTESMPSESSAASNKLFILQQTGFSRSKKMIYLKSSAKRDFLSQELI